MSEDDHFPLLDECRVFEVVGRGRALLRMSSAVLVQTKGSRRSFQPSMKVSIVVTRSFTEVRVPRRMALSGDDPEEDLHLALGGVSVAALDRSLCAGRSS